MIEVWILTAMLANGVHHYSDTGVYAAKGKCEMVRNAMKAMGDDTNTECRKVAVHE